MNSQKYTYGSATVRLIFIIPLLFILSCSSQESANQIITGGGAVINPGAQNPQATAIAKLIPSDDVNELASFGSSLAISADGKTAVVGAKTDNSGTGAAVIYSLIDGVWVRQMPKLVGNNVIGSAAQGSAVAISGDGNTIAVGGPNDNTMGSTVIGAVWIFVKTGGAWMQQGSKLVGSGMTGIGQAYFGSALSLSADGNTVLIGAFGDNYWRGAAWVYTRSAGAWSQQGSKLSAA